MFVIKKFGDAEGSCILKPCRGDREVMLLEDGKCQELGDSKPCPGPLSVRISIQLGNHGQSFFNKIS